MNGYGGLDDEQAHEEESFGRPFLGRAIKAESVDSLRNEPIDEAAVEQFMGEMIATLDGGMKCFSVLLGDELGLYRIMAEAGSMTAEELAGKGGCNLRLTQEWLDGQVAGRWYRDFDEDGILAAAGLG